MKKLPTGDQWTNEIKLDGFRARAVRTRDQVVLYSRQGKILTNQFSQIAKELLGSASPESMVKRSEHVEVAAWTAELESLERFVRERKLEGIIAKRSDSRYETGRRSGSWVKMRFNCRQEFVIGGYTPSNLGLDAILVGFYQDNKLRFAGSVRAGFNPQSRREVHDQIKHLETGDCPFVNLPDRRAGAWGQGITAEKMKQCPMAQADHCCRNRVC